MNERHDWLDDELAAIAREDTQIGVPAHLESAILRAWDERPSHASKPHRSRHVIAWGLSAGAAAIVLGGFLFRPQPHVPIGTPIPAANAVRPGDVEPALETPLIERNGPRPRGVPHEARRASGRSAALQEEYVIVPDPFARETPMNIVRVQMSRTAFATLGVPIANPDAEGLVEVEMLVGDDGVARTIRRATFVDNRLDGGLER